MRGWRAWYDDGTLFSSDMMTWADMPAVGMVGGVVYLDPPYRELFTCGDFYYLADGRIHRVKMHPEWGEWADPPKGVPPEMLKKSGAMSDEAWERVQAEMMGARIWP